MLFPTTFTPAEIDDLASDYAYAEALRDELRAAGAPFTAEWAFDRALDGVVYGVELRAFAEDVAELTRGVRRVALRLNTPVSGACLVGQPYDTGWAP